MITVGYVLYVTAEFMHQDEDSQPAQRTLSWIVFQTIT